MTLKLQCKNQGYHHWYAKKYFSGKEECVSALRVLMDTLMENKLHKAFVTDFTQNLHLIVSHLEDPTYYDGLEEEIVLKQHDMIGTFDKFIGHRKTRPVPTEKIVPTWSQLEKKEIICEKRGNTTVFRVQDRQVTVEEMKRDVTDYLKRRNEDFKMQDKNRVMFVSEVAQQTYVQVEDKPVEDISVDKKISAEVVVNFVEKLKDNVMQKDYAEILQKSLTSKQAEIPVSYETKEGKKEYAYVILPRVLRYFMNHDHLVHNQDIAEAIIRRYGLNGQDKTSLMLQKEFNQALGMKEEMPLALLFNPSWLETIPFEKIQEYCPVYTGYTPASWVLMRADGYQGCMNKDTFKLILMMIVKMAKFYGLWMRGGLTSQMLVRYVLNVLKLTTKKVYGFAIHQNIKEWMEPLEISKYKETSMLVVKEDTNIFDNDYQPQDLDKIFDGFQGSRFEPEVKMHDRDDGELNENKKLPRGRNNEGHKRMRKKEKEKSDRKKEKKRLEKKKRSKKRSSKVLESSEDDKQHDPEKGKKGSGDESGSEDSSSGDSDQSGIKEVDRGQQEKEEAEGLVETVFGF